MKLYRVQPGIVLWLRNVCRAIYLHRMPQGWRLEYVRYDRTPST